jgi:hypothetical protein
MKFIVEARVKPAETIRQLSPQCREETVSHTSICDGYSKFSEGHEEVLIQPTAVQGVNIRGIKGLILGNR